MPGRRSNAVPRTAPTQSAQTAQGKGRRETNTNCQRSLAAFREAVSMMEREDDVDRSAEDSESSSLSSLPDDLSPIQQEGSRLPNSPGLDGVRTSGNPSLRPREVSVAPAAVQSTTPHGKRRRSNREVAPFCRAPKTLDPPPPRKRRGRPGTPPTSATSSGLSSARSTRTVNPKASAELCNPLAEDERALASIISAALLMTSNAGERREQLVESQASGAAEAQAKMERRSFPRYDVYSGNGPIVSQEYLLDHPSLTALHRGQGWYKVTGPRRYMTSTQDLKMRYGSRKDSASSASSIVQDTPLLPPLPETADKKGPMMRGSWRKLESEYPSLALYYRGGGWWQLFDPPEPSTAAVQPLRDEEEEAADVRAEAFVEEVAELKIKPKKKSRFDLDRPFHPRAREAGRKRAERRKTEIERNG